MGVIGVGVASGDLETAAEFFELFKIAWEPVRPRTRYAEKAIQSGRNDDGSATFSPLDGSGIGGHKPPLLLDRLCTSLEFGVQTRSAGTT